MAYQDRCRNTGARLEVEQPRSWAEIAAWCSFYAILTLGVILASLYFSWVPA